MLCEYSHILKVWLISVLLLLEYKIFFYNGLFFIGVPCVL